MMRDKVRDMVKVRMLARFRVRLRGIVRETVTVRMGARFRVMLSAF